MSRLLTFLAIAVVLLPSVRADDEKPLTLTQRIDRQIDRVKQRELISERHTPWVIMHALIAYELDTEVFDSESQKKMGAVDYLCRHAKYEGKRIFRNVNGQPALPTRNLSFDLKTSFQVQDHVDQFLMAFADADVPLGTQIIAEGDATFTVEDMLKASQLNFQPRQELGWTLVAITSYLGCDARWKTSAGEEASVESLLALAVKRDCNRETEGGPHHLYGVAFALDAYAEVQENEVAGSWAEARSYLDRHIALAKKYQQENGSFSVIMFRGGREAQNPKEAVWATGHTLEWLTLALSHEQLQEEWVIRGVVSLLDVMEAHELEAFSDGGLYHAAHALRRYREKTGK